MSTPALTKIFLERMQQPGAVARKEGDAAAALAAAAKKIEAVYEVPFLAHAPMEPLNCTADVKADRCTVWASTQGQSAARAIAARVTGLPPEKVEVHTQYMGGGFGRRAAADYIGEAVEVSKAVSAPVKLTWSREDDMQQDLYRPASYTRFAGALDADGWPLALSSRIACPPFGGVRNGLSRTGVEGIADLAVRDSAHAGGLSRRGCGDSGELLALGGLLAEYLLRGKLPRRDGGGRRQGSGGGAPPPAGQIAAPARRAELAAEKSGWGKPPAAGRARGVSLVNNIGSFTAQVAEVSVTGGKVKVHRVVCAVDCGHVVNPAILEQQIQSGIVFGLAAALKGGITIDRGRVQQSNFHQYDVLRIDEMPVVEVHIVTSQNASGGIGEASTPGIAPAVCNAIFKATGKRIRRLPIRKEDLA